MTKAEIDELWKVCNEAPAQIWMSRREIVLALKKRNPDKKAKYAVSTWLSGTGKDVPKLLPEPLPKELETAQKYNRKCVLALLGNKKDKVWLQACLQRTAEADASGEWIPLSIVQCKLKVCNEKFERVSAVSSFLSTIPVGKSIRRLYDASKEKVPGLYSLQRYYLPDVIRVADTYRAREQTYRFVEVDTPPEHTWLSFAEISMMTGCPRQRLVDLATRGYIEAVLVRKTFDVKRGAKSRLVCYADFAAVREVLCWRSRVYATRVMGETWMRERVAWQEKYGLEPPIGHVSETSSAAVFSVYAPELVNEVAIYTRHVN